MTNGKTFLENTIIFDKGLSLEAIGLYAILKHYSTISDFQIRREHIKSVSGYGETSFRRVWKELKDSNLLLEHKKRINGKFEYEFTLSTSNKTAKEAKKSKKVSKRKMDKEETVEILEGQVSIYDISTKDIENLPQADVQSSDTKEVTLTQEIIEATGCTKEVANASVEYAKSKCAKNLKSYAIASVKGGFTCSPASIQHNTYIGNYTGNNRKRIPFIDDCCSRDRSKGNSEGNMTYEEIEKQLLGWYADESEENEEVQEGTGYEFLKKYGIGSAI